MISVLINVPLEIKKLGIFWFRRKLTFYSKIGWGLIIYG